MDAKTACELLRTHYVWIDGQGKSAKHITKENAEEIAHFIERQETLTKLGAAAKKVVDTTKQNRRFTSSICVGLPPEVNEYYCSIDCMWFDFCKLRKE